jgi:cell division protein FtsB
MNEKDDAKIKELTEKLDKLVLRVNELEKQVEELKNGSLGTGVYLDGTPEYVREYIKNYNQLWEYFVPTHAVNTMRLFIENKRKPERNV